MSGILGRAVGIGWLLAVGCSSPWASIDPTLSAAGKADLVRQWQPAAPMHVARAFPTATLLLDGRVLVTGGDDASCELYDPTTGMWQPTGSMHAPRTGHTPTLLPSGEVLVAGGIDETVELYDPNTGTWRSGSSMATPRPFHSATLMGDGTVLVVGGPGTCYLSQRGCPPIVTAEIYDPGDARWHLTSSPGDDVEAALGALLPQGRVLIVSAGDSFRRTEVYDPSIGTWTQAGFLIRGREDGTMTALRDGRVLFVGADPLDGPASEIYDSATGQWSAIGGAIDNRDCHVAVLLQDGDVLVSGGLTESSEASSSASVFHAGTSTWEVMPPMTVGRRCAAAALLPGGQVLVLGGIGKPAAPLASAELFF